MGVYIKGMEMPGSCYYCPFADGSWGYSPPHKKRCLISGKDMTVDERYVQKNQPVCPLVPVPPHGRLIDADALVKDLKHQCEEVFKIDAVSPDDFWITRDHAYNERLWKTWCESFFEYLKGRDTVIPASEETTNELLQIMRQLFPTSLPL